VSSVLIRNQSIHTGILSSKCKSSVSSVLICSATHRTACFALLVQTLFHFPKLLPFFTYLPFLCKGGGTCSLFCSGSKLEIQPVIMNILGQGSDSVSDEGKERVRSFWKTLSLGSLQCQTTRRRVVGVSGSGQAAAGIKGRWY